MAIVGPTAVSPPSIRAVIVVRTAGMCPPVSRPQLNPDDQDEQSLNVWDPDVALVSDSSEPPVVPKRLDVAWDSDLTEDSGPDDIRPGRAPSRLRKADEDTDYGDSGVGIDDGGVSAGTR
ncbi:unnamed protein product [Phytophthora fragariaefolia]|uniref:Unnamed protein product n=1 Tax=Phytophthora fragariaefolia TaxID=1490495 RepID=A0A9W7CNU1_9STRA|nr:unnamed protein product [Phytophthora fragariaefolia]